MHFLHFFIKAAKRWHTRDAEQRAAALAYFTPFALSPLIIFSITIVGVVLGSQHVIDMLIVWGKKIDPGVTGLVYDAVLNFNIENNLQTHYFFPVVGLLFLLLMVFVALNSFTAGLHALWDIRVTGVRSMLKRLWRSAIFILVFQLYLITMILVADAFTLAVGITGMEWVGAGFRVVSVLGTMFLLTFAYGILPLYAPSYTARLAGALVATTLLLFARELVALYFTTASVASLFGAAGLLISLLVWVYVAAAIMLYGAACAFVYDQDRHRELTK